MGFHRHKIQTENTRTDLQTSSVPQMGRFEISLVSSACVCHRPGYIRDIQQSFEGSVVKMSLHTGAGKLLEPAPQ